MCSFGVGKRQAKKSNVTMRITEHKEKGAMVSDIFTPFISSRIVHYIALESWSLSYRCYMEVCCTKCFTCEDPKLFQLNRFVLP